MRTSGTFAISAALLVIFTIVILNSRSSENSQSQTSDGTVTESESAANARPSHHPPVVSKMSDTSVAPNRQVKAQAKQDRSIPKEGSHGKPLNQLIPNMGALRDEVKSNPHNTPRAMIQFSLELGDRVDSALQTEYAAHKFFPELESCVLSSDTDKLHSVQALCLHAGKELSNKYPTLESKFSRLKNEAGTRTLEIFSKLP